MFGCAALIAIRGALIVRGARTVFAAIALLAAALAYWRLSFMRYGGLESERYVWLQLYLLPVLGVLSVRSLLLACRQPVGVRRVHGRRPAREAGRGLI